VAHTDTPVASSLIGRLQFLEREMHRDIIRDNLEDRVTVDELWNKGIACEKIGYISILLKMHLHLTYHFSFLFFSLFFFFSSFSE
jgi:hypothetical protein